MASLKELLQDADALRHEQPAVREHRDRIRHRVLATLADADAAPDIRPRRTSLLVPATLALIVAVIVGSRMSWQQTSVQAAVRFEVHLAENQPAAGLRAARVGSSNRVIYLHPEVVVTNADIASSRVIPGDAPSHFWIDVRLNAAGADKMRQTTMNHLGRPVAILIDGEVVSVPTVKSPLGAAAVISGDYTQAEAERIAQGMNPNQ